MSKYFFIEPEVAGSPGERSVIDRSTHPPKISRLHYEFDGWLGDQLLEGFPCFIATKALAEELIKHHFTGFEVASVEITSSEQFKELEVLHPNRKLPPFYWLKITGEAGKDDFGILQNDWRLVVSKSVLDVIKPRCPSSFDVSEYEE